MKYQALFSLKTTKENLNVYIAKTFIRASYVSSLADLNFTIILSPKDTFLLAWLTLLDSYCPLGFHLLLSDFFFHSFFFTLCIFLLFIC